jgi:hypothetical protein
MHLQQQIGQVDPGQHRSGRLPQPREGFRLADCLQPVDGELDAPVILGHEPDWRICPGFGHPVSKESPGRVQLLDENCPTLPALLHLILDGSASVDP